MDQETAQAEGPVRIGAVHRSRPAAAVQPGVPKLIMGRAYKLAHQAAGEGRRPMWMFVHPQRVSHRTLSPVHLLQKIEIPDPGRVQWDINRIHDRHFKLTRPVHHHRTRRSLPAASKLLAAECVDERELSADFAGTGPVAVKLLLQQNCVDPRAP